MKDFGALLTGNTYLECDSLYTIILVCKETVTMLRCGRERTNDQDLERQVEFTRQETRMPFPKRAASP